MPRPVLWRVTQESAPTCRLTKQVRFYDVLLRVMQNQPSKLSPPNRHRNLLNPDAQFHVLEHDPAADLNALKQLIETLEKFSPVVGMEQDFRQIGSRKKPKPNKLFQPSSVLLDVTGLSHLFGGYHSLAALVSQHCRQHDCHARIAIANTIGLAWGVSHFDPDCRFDQPQVVSGDDLSIRHRLPVMALRIDATTCQTLQRLGIETIGQLLGIDRGDLRSRLGDDLIRRIDQFAGRSEEPVVVSRQPPEFAANKLLEYPTSHRETIAAVVDRLVVELCAELKSRQLGSLQWKVRLLSQQKSNNGLDFRVSLFQPTATATHVIPLAAMQLEQILMTRSAAELSVKEVIVEVASCVLLVQQQRQLFDENPRLDRQALAHLINRLTSRLGNDNVVYPTFRSGAQPEVSFQFRPLVDPHRKRQKSRAVRTSHVLGRPLRLLTPPVAVAVQREPDEDREPVFRKPLWITFNSGVNRTEQRIARSWGPERIETGWWRGSTVQRDYWCIVTEAGVRLWVFCDLKARKWFVHGEF